MWQLNIGPNMKLIIFILLFVSSLSLLSEEISIREIPRPDKKGPWPEFEVKIDINATPLESVAIYYALDYQQEYVPNVIKSRVIDQPTPLEAVTEYELETPWPIPNSLYTNGSKLHFLEENTYKVQWWMIKNNSADETTGYAQFNPISTGTRFIYRSYVEPKSFLATFFKSRAKEDILKTIRKIKDHIEFLKKNKSPILEQYTQKILEAQNNQFTYIKKLN